MAKDDIKQFEFKKGDDGRRNLKGRPPVLVSDVIKELEAQGIRQTTKTEIQKVYLMLINQAIPDLENIAKDSKHPALVRIVTKAILSGKGFEIIEKILDRSIGKPDAKMDVEMNEPLRIVVKSDWKPSDE